MFNHMLHFRPLRLLAIRKAAEEMGVNLNHAIGARRHYLSTQLRFWTEATIDSVTWQVIAVPMIRRIVDDLTLIRKDLAWLDRPTKTGEITPEMIQRAREYPIAELFDFARGRTQCPFHKSKSNDLSYHAKSNTVRCFGACGQSWDTIKVLMQRDDFSFPEAVRRLN